MMEQSHLTIGLALLLVLVLALRLRSGWARRAAAGSSVLAHLRDGVVVVDGNGCVARINPAAAEILMLDPAREHGRPLAEVLVRIPALQSLPDGFEGEVSLDDGDQHRVCQVRVNSIDDAGVRGRMILLRDVTAVRQTELALLLARDQALAAARSRSDFLATVSHEIRTPMNGIVGATDLLLGSRLDRDQRDLAETVRSSADALLGIIDGMLDFSRIEAGRIALEAVTFDLPAMVDDVVGLFGARARGQGIDLVCKSDPLPPLRGDAGRLRQVLGNLIANALKFTEKGSIEVRCQRESGDEAGAWIRLSVSDTGIGIEAAAQAALFEPFVQADGSMTRRYGGTGLGLAICRRLVEIMGGEIGVRSEVGRGSTFTVRVPLEFAESAAAATREPPRPVLRGSAALLLDLRSATRRSLEANLRAWGAAIDTADQSGQAIAMLRVAARQGRPFSWLLADLGVAPDDILRVLHTVRAESALRGTRVLLLHDLAQAPEIDRLRQQGLVDAGLVKPLRESRLRECIASLLAHGRDVERAAPAKSAPPRAAVEPAAPPAPAEPASAPPAPARILVVEDNPVNQKVTLRLLATLGHRADVVEHGRAAVDATAEPAYDLVLMDCQMPVMDGFEATRAIRQREAGGEHLCIVAMTANAMEGDRERCLEAGMDDYLAKPVRKETLAAMLARWLSKAGEARVA